MDSKQAYEEYKRIEKEEQAARDKRGSDLDKRFRNSPHTYSIKHTHSRCLKEHRGGTIHYLYISKKTQASFTEEELSFFSDNWGPKSHQAAGFYLEGGKLTMSGGGTVLWGAAHPDWPFYGEKDHSKEDQELKWMEEFLDAYITLLPDSSKDWETEVTPED